MIRTQHEPKQNVTTYKVGRFVIQYFSILHRRSSSEAWKRSTSSSEDPVIQKAISLASGQSNCSTPSSSSCQTPVRYVSLSGLMGKSSSLNPIHGDNSNDSNNNQTSTSLTAVELSHYSQIPEYNRSKSVCLFENKSSTPQAVYNPDTFRSQNVESVPEENEPPQIINPINEQSHQQQQQQQQQTVFQADELVIQTPTSNAFDINNNNNNNILEPPSLPQPASVEKEPLLINPIILEPIPSIISPDNNQMFQQNKQPKSFDDSAFFTEPEMIIDNIDNNNNNNNNNNSSSRQQQSKSMVSPELLLSMEQESYNIQQQQNQQPLQPIQAPIQLNNYINEQTYSSPNQPLNSVTIVDEQIPLQQQLEQQQQQHLISSQAPPPELIEEQLLLVQQQENEQQQQQQQQQQQEISVMDNSSDVIINNNNRNISPTNPRIEVLQRSNSNHSVDSIDSPFVSSVKELGTPCPSPYQIWDDLPKERQIELLYKLIDTVNTDGKIYDIMFPQTNHDWKKRTRNSLLEELNRLSIEHESLQNQYNQLKNLQNKNLPM